MPTGKPDWQDVPRGFNARQLSNQTITLAAGASQTFTFTPADIDDVFALYLASEQRGIWSDVAAESPLGDIIHRVRAGTRAGRPVWTPVQSAGGDVVVTVTNFDVGSANDIVVRAWSYIGVSAEDLRPTTDVRHQRSTSLVNGGTLTNTHLNTQWMSEISIGALSNQSYQVQHRWLVGDSDSPTSFITRSVVVANQAANTVFTGTIKIVGLEDFVLLLNNSGATATSVDLSTVARRRS